MSDWLSTIANVASIIAALVVPAAAFFWRTARRWVTTNVTEKLDGLAADVRTLATKHSTLSDRFDDHLHEADRRNARLDAHLRDHDVHRRSWRI